MKFTCTDILELLVFADYLEENSRYRESLYIRELQYLQDYNFDDYPFGEGYGDGYYYGDGEGNGWGFGIENAKEGNGVDDFPLDFVGYGEGFEQYYHPFMQ